MTLVERLLTERFGFRCEAVRWLPVESSAKARRGPPPSPRDILSDENLLPRFLEKLLRPVRRNSNDLVGVDLVVLTVDADLAANFSRAVNRLRLELRRRTAAVCFEPELEVLLVQSKTPLESAVGVPHCSTEAPSRTGDLKVSLRDWVTRFGRGRVLDAQFRQEVARYLDVSANSHLCSIPCWLTLTGWD